MQYDFGVIDPDHTDGTQLSQHLNNWRDAVLSAHKGAADPTYALAGMVRLDDASMPWLIKRFDGTDWVVEGEFDPNTNIVSYRHRTFVLVKTASYSIGVNDFGRLIKVNATSGAVTITLPAIADAKNGFPITIVKGDSTVNVVTVQRSAGDTIGGAEETSIILHAQDEAVDLRADASNGNWVKISSASGTVSGAHYTAPQQFTKNSSTTLTLEFTPPTVYGLYVEVGGVRRWPNVDFTVSGNELTWLNSSGNGQGGYVEYRGRALDIGEPGDGTVTTAKLGAGAVTTEKLADESVTAAKLAPGSSSIGRHTIFISGMALFPRSSSGPDVATAERANNLIMELGLDVDPNSNQYAQFPVGMPESWDGGPIYVQCLWTAHSSSGNVTWGAQALACGDGDGIDTAMGTAQEVTDTLQATGALHITDWTAGITPSGTPGKGDMIWLQVYRAASAGTDTLGADARLLGVRVAFTVDAATDD